VTRVAVVIPNWNGAHLLDACLLSLRAQDLPASSVIVVDNGSTDGSRELLRDHHPDVMVVALTSNRGFAGGVNAGFRAAIRSGADMVALLNNDAEADQGWLAALVSAGEAHPEAGVVTGKLLLADGTHLDCAGEGMSVWGMPYPRGRGEVDRGQYDVPDQVFAASGGASLYRVSMLLEVGLFDERFFAYLEDIDLSFRARLRGWDVRYAPAAVARHRMGATSATLPGFTYRHTLRNLTLLYCKDMPAALWWRSLPRFLVEWALIASSGLRRGQVAAFATAVAGTVRHLPPTLRARRHVQRRRLVGDAEIAALLSPGLPPGQWDAIASAARGRRPPR
jgi:GT2 family glycosyltransferase